MKLKRNLVEENKVREVEKPKVIVIAGPTASGKTALSIELAKQINGEIVSCDSMQIYEEMDIGTAKPTQEEKQGILHYMMDCVSPEKRYSVSDYKKGATHAIEQILQKQKVPIVVGGTGLYINSLIYHIEYEPIGIDQEYRELLEKRVQKEGLQTLYEEAVKIDPKAMEKISNRDQKRILRVLEIYQQTGKTKTEQEQQSRQKENPYQFKVFVLQMDREVLYERINQRVNQMIEQGLIQEVEEIYQKYQQFPTAMQGIGYKEVVSYLRGEITKEEMIEKIKMETRRYAKRQITWFKKIEDVIWLNGEEKIQNNINIILEEIK